MHSSELIVPLFLLTSTYSTLQMFNSHFPGGSGLASTRMSPFWILLEFRTMDAVVTTGAIGHAKFQSNHHHQQNNTQCFYKPDPQPAVIEHGGEKLSHSTDLITPSSPGLFQPCLWPLKPPGYLGGALPSLSSNVLPW